MTTIGDRLTVVPDSRNRSTSTAFDTIVISHVDHCLPSESVTIVRLAAAQTYVIGAQQQDPAAMLRQSTWGSQYVQAVKLWWCDTFVAFSNAKGFRETVISRLGREKWSQPIHAGRDVRAVLETQTDRVVGGWTRFPYQPVEPGSQLRAEIAKAKLDLLTFFEGMACGRLPSGFEDLAEEAERTLQSAPLESGPAIKAWAERIAKDVADATD